MDLIAISLLGNNVKPLSKAEGLRGGGEGEFQELLAGLGLDIENSVLGRILEEGSSLSDLENIIINKRTGANIEEGEGSFDEKILDGSKFGIDDLPMPESDSDFEPFSQGGGGRNELPSLAVSNPARLTKEHRLSAMPVFSSFVLGGSMRMGNVGNPQSHLSMKGAERPPTGPVVNLDEGLDGYRAEAPRDNLISQVMSQGSQGESGDTERRMGRQMLDGNMRRGLPSEAKFSGTTQEAEPVPGKGVSLDSNAGRSRQPNASRTTESVVPITDSLLSSVPKFKIEGTGETKPSLPVELTEAKPIIHQIAQKLVYSNSRNGMSIQFRLEPEWLGPLRVDLSIHHQKINANITTNNSYVRQLVEAHQELLRETLAEYGYRVDRFVVSVGEPSGPSSLSHEPPGHQKWSPPSNLGGSGNHPESGDRPPREQHQRQHEGRGTLNLYA